MCAVAPIEWFLEKIHTCACWGGPHRALTLMSMPTPDPASGMPPDGSTCKHENDPLLPRKIMHPSKRAGWATSRARTSQTQSSGSGTNRSLKCLTQERVITYLGIELAFFINLTVRQKNSLAIRNKEELWKKERTRFYYAASYTIFPLFPTVAYAWMMHGILCSWPIAHSWHDSDV